MRLIGLWPQSYPASEPTGVIRLSTSGDDLVTTARHRVPRTTLRPTMGHRDVYGSPPPPRRRTDETRVSRRGLFGLGMSGRATAEIDYRGADAQIAADAETGAAWPVLARIAVVAELLAEDAAVAAGDRVLDVGAGPGRVAAACAARDADVTACDASFAAVARGSEDGPPGVAWHAASPADLPFETAAFDAVVSGFGVTQASRPARVLEEIVRVCRPGGRVAVATWVPRGLPGRLTEFAEGVRPLPDGVPSACGWGRRDVLQARMAAVLDEVEVRTRSVRIDGLEPDALFDALAPGTFSSAQRAELRPAFDRLLASASNTPGTVDLDARFLIASGRRPGERQRAN